MATEIERKFLVDAGRLWKMIQDHNIPYVQIVQGYLNTGFNATVRVRTEDDKGYIVVKGPREGISCPEFDYEIPFEDAQQMLTMTVGTHIMKKRYYIPYAGHTWHVDVFEGVNTGLFVAEIELDSEDEQFVSPPWLMKEVSDDPSYLNFNLAIQPFAIWRTK